MKWREYFSTRFYAWWRDRGRETFDRITGHKVKHFHGIVGKPYGRVVFIEGATVERVRIIGVLEATAAACKSDRDKAFLCRIAKELNRDDLVQDPLGNTQTLLEFQQKDPVVLWMKEHGLA